MHKIIKLIAILALLNMTCCRSKIDEVIFQMQPGDFSKSCTELKSEIAEVTQVISQQNLRKNSRHTTNGAFVIAAIFTLGLTLLFTDFSGADQKKLAAHQKRLDNLDSIAKDKGCQLAAS